MQIVSVNIGQEEPLTNAKSGTTGIFKRPVAFPVAVTRTGLADDHIIDTRNHGGEDQAVYLYGLPGYDWWEPQLGRPLAPGTFGENLTVSDMESASARIGDRYRIGDVLLEVTAPRIPCITLARRMDDLDFVNRFRTAERPGLYCRVLQTGLLQAGAQITLEPFPGNDAVTALELFRAFFQSDPDEATLRRYLAQPLAARDRAHWQAQLDKLLTASIG